MVFFTSSNNMQYNFDILMTNINIIFYNVYHSCKKIMDIFGINHWAMEKSSADPIDYFWFIVLVKVMIGIVSVDMEFGKLFH